jgi:hypothetical protein
MKECIFFNSLEQLRKLRFGSVAVMVSFLDLNFLNEKNCFEEHIKMNSLFLVKKKSYLKLKLKKIISINKYIIIILSLCHLIS